ncbi:MAG: type II toxin-antitoxin system PemK/MazF family toxin, partial [Aggregatilineales bacterium]
MPDKLNPHCAEMQTGAIHWLNSEYSEIAHPHVIIDIDAAENMITVCALTSNLKRVSLPGNILLNINEANLSRQSVVEVSKVTTVDISQLGTHIGTLNETRMTQITAGIRFVQRSFL